jgi:hypothetical protein
LAAECHQYFYFAAGNWRQICNFMLFKRIFDKAGEYHEHTPTPSLPSMENASGYLILKALRHVDRMKSEGSLKFDGYTTATIINQSKELHGTTNVDWRKLHFKMTDDERKLATIIQIIQNNTLDLKSLILSKTCCVCKMSFTGTLDSGIVVLILACDHMAHSTCCISKPPPFEDGFSSKTTASMSFQYCPDCSTESAMPPVIQVLM